MHVTIPNNKTKAILEIGNFFGIFPIEFSSQLGTKCSSLWEGVRPPKNNIVNHQRRYSCFSAAVGSKIMNCYINI